MDRLKIHVFKATNSEGKVSFKAETNTTNNGLDCDSLATLTKKIIPRIRSFTASHTQIERISFEFTPFQKDNGEPLNSTEIHQFWENFTATI